MNSVDPFMRIATLRKLFIKTLPTRNKMLATHLDGASLEGILRGLSDGNKSSLKIDWVEVARSLRHDVLECLHAFPTYAGYRHIGTKQT